MRYWGSRTNRLGALGITLGALTAVLTGCNNGHSNNADPKHWCGDNAWIGQATYDYAYWQEQHSPSDVERATDYGGTLMHYYQQDQASGKLPADISDKDLKSWSLNLAKVQGSTKTTAAVGLDKGGLFSNYLNQVHAACD